MKILITGGAGFVGANLALLFREKLPNAEIVVADNLKRRGAELNLESFRRHGIHFKHTDIRQPSDLLDLNSHFDLMVEASAEASVLAGVNGSPAYLIDTNLLGTCHCLEYARNHVGALIFLSTSRVYSMKPLRELPLVESTTRFSVNEMTSLPGFSAEGVAEEFPTHLPRSLYGATKLASELLIQEYVSQSHVKAVVNRCGVLAGPGQFGKEEQGFFALWFARHLFGGELSYKGFGGLGKQVRDVLHPRDLFDLLWKQWDTIETCSGGIYNVGGGKERALSLLELTALCQKITGQKIPIRGENHTSSVDIPYFVTDSRRAKEAFHWEPKIGLEQLGDSVCDWLKKNEVVLRPILTPHSLAPLSIAGRSRGRTLGA